MTVTPHRDFIADLRSRDVPVPRGTLKAIRARLTDTQLARWETADMRVALVDAIDQLLKEKQ